jgi:hypothetical protein
MSVDGGWTPVSNYSLCAWEGGEGASRDAEKGGGDIDTLCESSSASTSSESLLTGNSDNNKRRRRIWELLSRSKPSPPSLLYSTPPLSPPSSAPFQLVEAPSAVPDPE